MLTRQLLKARKVIALIVKGQVRIENVTAAACGGLILALMMVTAINVFGRKFFQPLDGAVELSSLLLFTLFIVPLGYVYRIKGHIGIEFISERLSPRKRAITELFTLALLLPLMGLLTWQGVDYVVSRWNEATTGLIRFTLWPFLIFLPLGLGLLGLRILRRIFETIAEIRGPRSEGETR